MEETGKPFNYKELTIEDVKAEDDFKHLTNEQAKDVLSSLEQLALIFFDIWRKKKPT
jgi:hypothetical protein